MGLEPMSKLMIFIFKTFIANHFFTLSLHFSIEKKWTVQCKKRKLAFLDLLEIYWKEQANFEDCCWGIKFASTLVQNCITQRLLANWISLHVCFFTSNATLRLTNFFSSNRWIKFDQSKRKDFWNVKNINKNFQTYK